MDERRKETYDDEMGRLIEENEDGTRFVRCRLVGRDFKVKHEVERDDLFAAMPPLEAKKTLFRMTAGVRGWRRRRGPRR